MEVDWSLAASTLLSPPPLSLLLSPPSLHLRPPTPLPSLPPLPSVSSPFRPSLPPFFFLAHSPPPFSTPGEFSEMFNFQLQGSDDLLTCQIKGHVVGPTFNFDVDEIDFGVVSYSFMHKKTITLSNTSDIPMEYVRGAGVGMWGEGRGRGGRGVVVRVWGGGACAEPAEPGAASGRRRCCRC